MPETVDVLIIGGGIAGISLAARLAGRASVAVVEAEEHIGTHTTGRSAAMLVEAYGPPPIRRLTSMSRPFFEDPPDGFSGAPLSGPRGALAYAGEDQLARLEQEFALARGTTHVDWLDAGEVQKVCPLLKAGVAAAGFLEPGALDLDANGLLQGFARIAQRNGARIYKAAPTQRIERQGGGWLVAAGREIACGIVVDAAGAWADAIADLAGVARRRLQPMRRTAATIAVPADLETVVSGLPLVAPVDESFYFKPDARALMVSLSDETPSDPCDAYPDDFDVAVALDRFHAATIVPPIRPTAAWAGLRTFAPDRIPVVGFDADMPGFFWYAGQGGYGIQTAPGLSALATKLVLNEPLDRRETELAAALDPERFRQTA
jgi:D-arginine dehydrogenase